MGFKADTHGGFRPDPQPTAAPKETPVTGTAGGLGVDDFMPKSPMPVGEAALAIGSNMIAEPLGGYAGLVGAALPGPSGQGARWSENVSNALTFNPRSDAAKKIVDIASVPGKLVGKVAEKVGERGAQYSPAVGAFGKASAEVLPTLLGARAGMRGARPLSAEQQRAAAAMDKGYKLTPQEMGAGPVAKTVASLAGEPRLAKLTSAKNQPKVVSDAKAELGIPQNAELNLDSLGAARKEAHKDYEAIRGVGDVPTDHIYAAEADAIGQEYRSAARSFPKLATKDVEGLAEGLKVAKFNASEAIDQIGILRKQADEFFRKGDTRLAKANRAAADMIEAQIGRYLETSGQKDLLAKYQAARERIAKSYAVQKAVVGDDAVNPQKLGAQVKAGKPLTGKLREVGEVANDFERSLQKPTHQATGATSHDTALVLLNAIRSGGASLVKELPFLFVRPAVRSFLASKFGQKLSDPRTNLRVPEALGTASVPRNGEEKKP